MNELALFAGAGGGILGGHLLGWRTRCAVEIDAYARDRLLQRQADGVCQGSRSGMTCARSMGSLGQEAYRSSAEDSPALTSAAQGQKKGLTETQAGYGWKWPGSLAKYDRILHSWKTRQTSLFTDSTEFLGIWPRWGSMRDGELSELTPLVQTTKENESGLWLTPKATDTGRGEKSETFVKRMGDRGAHCFQSLPSQVGGKLNPEWVEWLMGWPIGWTACAALGTDRFQEWQQRHGGF